MDGQTQMPVRSDRRVPSGYSVRPSKIERIFPPTSATTLYATIASERRSDWSGGGSVSAMITFESSVHVASHESGNPDQDSQADA